MLSIFIDSFQPLKYKNTQSQEKEQELEEEKIRYLNFIFEKPQYERIVSGFVY